LKVTLAGSRLTDILVWDASLPSEWKDSHVFTDIHPVAFRCHWR